MLTELPPDFLGTILQLLSFRDLLSLRLTCKKLKECVDSVKVQHLNVFLQTLPHEGKLFHSGEPLIYAESFVAQPEHIGSPEFLDRFRHLKRLTFQQKTIPNFVFDLERDLNCFEQLEHLEVRAFKIEGERLKLPKLRVLLVETIVRTRFVVDCKQLTAIHFIHLPEIVRPRNLKHLSFVEMYKEEFVKFCKKCPNLTRLTLSSHAFDSSLSCIPEKFYSYSELYCVLEEIMHEPESDLEPFPSSELLRAEGLPVPILEHDFEIDERSGLICKNELRCLEIIELNCDHYRVDYLSRFRWIIRGFIPPSRLWEDVGSPGRRVFERLRFYFGSQDLVNDMKFNELARMIDSEFGRTSLNLIELTYSNLERFQRPMEDLIAGLRHISIDKKLNLAEEPLLYRLANLRQLQIKGNLLDASTLNRFTRQFKYLEVLGLADCAIQGEKLALLPNHSLHLLMIENCTCCDLNFLKSFENLKNLYLFKLERQNRFQSTLELRENISAILKSLKYLTTFGQELGTLLIYSKSEIFLSPNVARTLKEMKDFYYFNNFTLKDGVRVNENDINLTNELNALNGTNYSFTSDSIRFRYLEEFFEYAFPAEGRTHTITSPP